MCPGNGQTVNKYLDIPGSCGRDAATDGRGVPRLSRNLGSNVQVQVFHGRTARGRGGLTPVFARDLSQERPEIETLEELARQVATQAERGRRGPAHDVAHPRPRRR